MNRINELGLDKNTEIVISGDHLIWTWPTAGWYEHGVERKLLTVIPTQKRGIIQKRTTWFDIAPTLLDLAGIKGYDPLFPFGESIFSEKNGSEAKDGDMSYIQNIIHMRA
jgi:phosphoglycerol transferase MdoB-like AlkP superfamily enzyme